MLLWLQWLRWTLMWQLVSLRKVRSRIESGRLQQHASKQCIGLLSRTWQTQDFSVRSQRLRKTHQLQHVTMQQLPRASSNTTATPAGIDWHQAGFSLKETT